MKRIAAQGLTRRGVVHLYMPNDIQIAGAALRTALAHDGPALVDVDVDPHEPPLPGKVGYEQVTGFVQSWLRGQPHKAAGHCHHNVQRPHLPTALPTTTRKDNHVAMAADHPFPPDPEPQPVPPPDPVPAPPAPPGPGPTPPGPVPTPPGPVPAPPTI